MDEDSGMRACARGTRCSAARSVRTEDGWERVPAMGPRPLCDLDRDHVKRTLGDLPSRYVTLWTHLGPGGGVKNGDRPPGKSGSKVPMNLGVDALMRELIEVTTSWEDRVREVAHLSSVIVTQGRRNGATHRALIRACMVLYAHSEALFSLNRMDMFRSRDMNDRRGFPNGAVIVRANYLAGWYIYKAPLNGTDGALELLNLAHKIRSTLLETRAPQHLEVRCSTCGQRTLERYDGYAGLEDEATCTTCGDTYSNQRYLLLLREEHEEAVARKKLRGRRPRSSHLHEE